MVLATAILGVAAGSFIAAGISLIRARGSRGGPAAGADDVEPGEAADADRTPGRTRHAFDLPRPLPVVRPSAGGEATPSEAAPPPAPPTAAEILAQHEAQVEKHYREPLDGKWAPTATKAYAEDLTAVGRQMQTHFTVAQLDCRSDTCVAVLDWSSRNQARVEWAHLLDYPYRANCGRTIVIPEPEGGGSGAADGPVRAKIVFDCSETKHEPIRSEPIPSLMATRAPASAG